jgi:Mg2+-importing ATPase
MVQLLPSNANHWTASRRVTFQKLSEELKESTLREISTQAPHITFRQLDSTTEGLAEDEAAQRLRLLGKNSLTTKEALCWWRLLLRVLVNPFNLLLAVLASISIAAPDPRWKTFIILLLMVFISCIIHFWQEYRSNLVAVKLSTNVSTKVQVRRLLDVDKDIKAYSRPIHIVDLVPGDVVQLHQGDSVPADCLLLGQSSMQIVQSRLTGESDPQRKTSRVDINVNEEGLFDLPNIAYNGTSIISGSGLGLVIATGDRTLLATITRQLNKRRPVTAFERGIRAVTYILTVLMLVMVATVFTINGTLTKKWGQAALFALVVAVGQIPEMLPAIINANLARGAFILGKKKTIVKSLPAIQNLGSMTVLCSDKTGTLTKDEISVHHFENCRGIKSEHILNLAYTSCTTQSEKSSAFDAAIVSKIEADLDGPAPILGQKIAEFPFNFERRRSSVIVQQHSGSTYLICKGAFEEISALCTHYRAQNGTPVHLRTMRHLLTLTRADKLNDEGYRVLGVATRLVPEELDPKSLDTKNLESGMILEGIITFADPPKESSFESIDYLQRMGVQVKILTGDNVRVATRVCRSLNLSTDPSDPECGGIEAITGPRLAQLSTIDFREAVRSSTIFAKLTPAQKGEVIICLKELGHVVGMLGDGINDCVALRAADVGISVDTAVPLAKDCADVILTEKDLSIIVSGVKIGRLTQGNSVKYIKMVASSNFGNVVSIFIASLWLPFQPMTSLQLLLQNLLYDISQIALPWDTMDNEYLEVPQQWDTKDLVRFILVFGPTSSVIDVLTFVLGRFYYGVQDATDIVGVQLFHTHWFLQGLLTQTLIVHLLRTSRIPFLQSRASIALIISTITIMGIGISIPYIEPVATMLQMVRPANSFLGFLFAELVLYCLMVQGAKMTYIRAFRRWL